MYQVILDESVDQSISCAVVESVANLTSRDPAELDSLWDSVDPEALDSFVAHADASSTPYQLTFRYEGYTVEIAGDAQIRLIPTGATSSAAAV